MQVTPYQEDEVVLVCSKDHPLCGHQYVTKEQLRELKYVSLFQSSTVRAIKSTLTEHHIQWQALQVVLVSTLSSLTTALSLCRAIIALPLNELSVDPEPTLRQLNKLL